ncbi:MAG: hypothetical protein PHP75_07185, partial [Methylacidiphilaceae bacterium]|nr:hypothetical protein [Candidatus Methylacidiphilaceae bacterium]
MAEALGLLHVGQVDAMVAAAPWIAEPLRDELASSKSVRILRDRALCAAAFWSITMRAPGREQFPALNRLEELRQTGLLGRIR